MRICFIANDWQLALVVERYNPQTDERRILAVGRLIKLHRMNEAEFALLVSDQFQGQGLGTELLRRLIQVGRDEHLRRITADILPDNRAMQAICQQLGFQLRRSLNEPVKAVIEW